MGPGRDGGAGLSTTADRVADAAVGERAAGELDDAAAERADDRVTIRRIAVFAAVVMLLVVVRTFVAEPVRVRSTSMEPTFRSGAALVVDKLSYRWRAPRRGEIVTAHDPTTGEPIVKRVVAVAGDSIGIEDGQLVRNGAPVAESYVDNDDMDGFYFGPVAVPAGHVFVLGDNRADSVDSRRYGPLAVADLDGRVLWTVWGGR